MSFRLIRLRWIVAFVAALLTVLDLFAKRWSLIDQLVPLAVISGAIAFAWGIWLSLQLNLTGRVQDNRRVFVHILIAMFLGLSGIILVRDAVEALAFVGLDPRPTMTNGVVVDHYTLRRSGRRASVSLGPGTRVHVQITPELYALLDKSPPNGACLTIAVETGRWGLRRALVPRPADPPYGLDQYVPCSRSGTQ